MRRIKKRINELIHIHTGRIIDVSKKRDPFIDIFKDEKDFFKQNHDILINKFKYYDALFMLHIDDFCTKSRKNSEYDYGGDPSSKLMQRYLTMFEKYPFLKATVFTIPEPRFIGNNMMNHKIILDDRFSIISSQNKGWLEFVKSDKFARNNEIAMHGLNHVQTDRIDIFPFLEFEYKDEKSSTESLIKGKNIFSDAGIDIFGFKPPSWGIGYNSGFGLLKALKKMNFDYVCMSSPVSGLNWKKKQVSNFFPTYYEGLLNIPQNINMNWDFRQIKKVIDFAIEIKGIIAPQLHFNEENNWMSDGIGTNTLAKLEKILNYLKERKILYITGKTISERWKK